MTDAVFVRTDILMHPEDRRRLHDEILQGQKSGVVILPPYCEVVYPKEIDVLKQIKAEVEQLEQSYGYLDYVPKDKVLQIIDYYMKGDANDRS